jgi:hypothetical protein
LDGVQVMIRIPWKNLIPFLNNRLKMKQIIFISVFFVTAIALHAVVPAFPTAEGFGSVSTGGRGGKVIEVTNLLDDANGTTEGSFRWALKQYPSEPVTIVFRVGGVIKLVADIRSSRQYGTTIAGQTAPGEGITIRQHKVNLGGSVNLVVRNIRFRIGLLGDTAFAAGGSVGIENAGRFIFDHCDFGWSGEENMTMYDDTMATVQWSILHEGLFACGHTKGSRGYGSQWGGQKVTFHHNLLAHNYNRSPRFNGARSNDINVLIDFVNNVNYNWGKENSCYGSDLVEGLTNKTNMVNNYYKPGAARPGTSSSFFTQASFNSSQTTAQIAVFYMDGNYMEGTANSTKNTDNSLGLDASAYVAKGVAKTSMIASTPFTVSYPVTTETASEAFTSVLAKAGVFPRDTTDRRIVNEVRTGTVSGKGTTALSYASTSSTTMTVPTFYNVVKGIIDNPVLAFGSEIAYPTAAYTTSVVDSDHDGMDDAWELTKGLDPANPEDRNTLAPSGYTALEVYLNSLMGETIPFSTDISGPGSGGFSFYPNPVTEELFLVGPETVNQYCVNDLSGKAIQQGAGAFVNSIHVGRLKAGIYLLALRTESGKAIHLKFLK